MQSPEDLEMRAFSGAFSSGDDRSSIDIACLTSTHGSVGAVIETPAEQDRMSQRK
ncbi:hypothetical protein BDW02DRAFT_575048 [Decorospora gaudefroyi]|uniref:Uncharacterized protein n=1 Tax=Decorospora gaudefroyi TaxID=184978 RepID=A0A6A5JVB5_9PLEO|nr:hypothetical protein BDW02DRAFT_575048 [Decorospora gaudefroyi]